jgi:hypothetical protein
VEAGLVLLEERDGQRQPCTDERVRSERGLSGTGLRDRSPVEIPFSRSACRTPSPVRACCSCVQHRAAPCHWFPTWP